jgi:hypothetical protein
MSDAYLTLATVSNTTPSDTPSCFLVPRWLPDGTRNTGFQIMRLKDKLADRANASSEVEYKDAYGVMVGQQGKGTFATLTLTHSLHTHYTHTLHSLTHSHTHTHTLTHSHALHYHRRKDYHRDGPEH